MKGFEFPELKTNSDNDLEIEKPILKSQIRQPFQGYDKESLTEPVVETEPATEEYANQNPYSDNNTTNPFVDYDDVEKVIEEDSYYDDDNEEYNDDSEDYSEEDEEELYDDSFKTLYKEIKEENEVLKRQRKEKIKDFKLAFVVFMTIILAALIIINAVISKDNKPIVVPGGKTEEKEKNENNADLIIDGVYRTGNTSDLEKYLEDNYSNVTNILSLGEVAKAHIESLIASLIETEFNSYDDFTIHYNPVLVFIDNLYKTKYKDISCLKEEDYLSYTETLSQLSAGAELYYEGLAYYNNNDFNNAYAAFKKIEETNILYKKATTKIETIYQEIITMIERDIASMTENIDSKSPEEQKAIYNQIKTILEKYGRAYTLVELNQNAKYQELLEKYTNLAL